MVLLFVICTLCTLYIVYCTCTLHIVYMKRNRKYNSNLIKKIINLHWDKLLQVTGYYLF